MTKLTYNCSYLIIMYIDTGDCEGDEDEPSLANVKGDEITICTDDSESEDEFTLEVEFESNPKPTKVQKLNFRIFILYP